MSGFYGSIVIRSVDIAQIRAALEAVAKESGTKFLVGPPLKGWISVFPNNQGQDISISASLAKYINLDFFQLMVHDDGLFAYHFYRGGRLCDQYNSDPNYFEQVSELEKLTEQGHLDVYADLVANKSNVPKVQKLLETKDGKEFIFESERMRQFAKLVGLPNAVSSYEYLQDGERDEIDGWKNFLEVPDEKEAKRRAKLKLKEIKKQLQAEGLLLAELLPPGPKKEAVNRWLHCCADTVNGGFLIAWAAMFNPTGKIPLMSFDPLKSNAQSETGMVFNGGFFSFQMSPSGKWLATSDDKTQVWDWAQKKAVFEVAHASSASRLSFTRDEKHLISAETIKIFITSLDTGRTEYKFETGSGGRQSAALHPEGEYMAVISLRNLALLNLKTGQIEKTLLCKGAVAFDLPDTNEAKEMLGNIAKLQANETLNAASSEADRFILESRVVGKQILYAITEGMRKLQFDASGQMLFCGTDKGMRVFKWNDLLAATNRTPKPFFTVDCPTNDPNGESVQDFFVDETRNQIVFSGSFGKICYLSLVAGRSGILLNPPEDVWITNMALSKEGIALCCTCAPNFEERNREVTRLQFWNYPALCKAAGLS